MKNLILLLIVLAAFVAAPNAVWLRYSTVRVTNETGVWMHRVSIQTASQSTPLGSLLPNSTRFAVLPTTFGEAQFILAYEVNGVPGSGCQQYVESVGYHVEVVVDKDRSVQCSVEQPLTSSLLIRKVL